MGSYAGNTPLRTSGFDFQLKWQGMALPTADVRLGNILFYLFAIRGNFHATLKQSAKRPHNSWRQFQILTGIGARNTGHRTGLAQVRSPVQARGFQQTAFLNIATTEVVAVEIGAFAASRSFHDCDYQYFPRFERILENRDTGPLTAPVPLFSGFPWSIRSWLIIERKCKQTISEPLDQHKPLAKVGS